MVKFYLTTFEVWSKNEEVAHNSESNTLVEGAGVGSPLFVGNFIQLQKELISPHWCQLMDHADHHCLLVGEWEDYEIKNINTTHIPENEIEKLLNNNFYPMKKFIPKKPRRVRRQHKENADNEIEKLEKNIFYPMKNFSKTKKDFNQ